MAHKAPALVAQTGTLATGVVTVSGTLAGYRAFTAALTDGDTLDVVVKDASGNQASYPATTWATAGGTLTLGSVDVEAGTVTDGAVTVWAAARGVVPTDLASGPITPKDGALDLNELAQPGADGADGADGWSPLIRLVTAGERRVLELYDWTGGEGTAPASTGYLGAAGLTATIGDAIDVRGAAGADGADGSDGAPGADGDDGPAIELQTSATHVQWRVVGNVAWTDLIALADITGPAGADGADGADATYSDANPQGLGASAAPGTAEAASRADHVHAKPTTGDVVGTTDTQTLTNKTLTQYKETTASATLTSATTLGLANGPVQRYSIDGTITLTMPTATGGESLMLILTNTASSTPSWASSPAITWMSEEDSGTPPSSAADTYKTSYSFVHDGAAWLGWKTGEETA